MNRFLSPDLIDSFLERTIDALPDNPSACTPCCESIAHGWRLLGLRPGDVVLLCLPSGKELLNQFFGVLLAQGVPALVPPNMPAARLHELRQVFGARAIVSYRLPPMEFSVQTHEAFGGLRVAIFPPAQEPAAAPGEVVLLTSGTSGFASGCVFDFEALLLNGRRHADSIGQRQEDVVLVSLPLYFSFALVAQALASLVCGNRMIISGPPFNAARYQRTLQECGVTVSSLTPVLVRSLLQTGADFLSELRVFSVGGDYAEPELVARLVDVREGGELYVTYGLTQAGPRVSTLAAHLEPADRYSSVGRPLEGTAVCLRPASDGSGLSQLYVTSDTVMKRPIGSVEGRPHHDPAGQRTTATGDAFEQDAEGYLYFKGRLCDYISRRGEKISLVAVRRMASQLPNVASAKTMIIRHNDGDEDFDLELLLNASPDAELDPREMLRGVLRRTEMPRSIRIEMADRATSHAYK
ncbi:MAG: acyl--CoA ligase [Acidobacteriia bacterium]|nr:acyl--CoA ligase [Terriglobia bacterium]